MNLLVKFFTALLALFLCLGCGEPSQNSSEINSRQATRQSIEANVFHGSFEVYIPFSSRLRAGQIKEIKVEQKSRLIALLVENGDRVEKDDLLASLMPLAPEYEYTPIDIYAPFAGIVSGLHYRVGDRIPDGKRLMIVKNLRNLSTSVTLNPNQISFVKKNSKVVLQIDSLVLTTTIDKINYQKKELHILVPNKRGLLNEQERIEGKIYCGPVEGSYISKSLVRGEPMQIRLQEGIDLTVSFPAFSEDKALLFPPIPDQDKIIILR